MRVVITEPGGKRGGGTIMTSGLLGLTAEEKEREAKW